MMKLGIISYYDRTSFERAKAKGLESLEFDINVCNDEKHFFASIPDIRNSIEATGVKVGAIGRWGSERITADGCNKEELEIERKMIESAAALSCPVYITNCNYIESISYDENCEKAIEYLGLLLEIGKEKGVKICTYNCDWNSFIFDEKAWSKVHARLPELGIKYDPSHCIYRGGNYLKEMKDWGDRFYHVHIKGSLPIDGQRYDDPPAGLDATNWGAFFDVLYTKNYDASLSIEPHSSYWNGELGEKGIDFTIRYIKQFIF